MKKLMIAMALITGTLNALEYETLVGIDKFSEFQKTLYETGHIIKEIRPVNQDGYVYIVKVVKN